MVDQSLVQFIETELPKVDGWLHKHAALFTAIILGLTP